MGKRKFLIVLKVLIISLFITNIASAETIEIKSNNITTAKLTELYHSITGDKESLTVEVFQKGIIGYWNLKAQKKLERPIITLIDFSLPSNKKRLWVIDLNQKKVIFHSLVAHGQMTGELYAKAFSNMPESHQSSLGFYITGKRYMGKHKLSLQLNGLEDKYNNKALDRAIVIHGATYVSDSWIKKYGRLGRSHGCPAIPVEISERLISYIENGTCLFIYYPDKNYEKDSLLLKSTVIPKV